MNPQLPRLIEDVRLLGEVSQAYRAAIPDVARLLRNTVVTGNTFTGSEHKIQALFRDVTSLSSTTRDFLQANGDNIIRLGELGRATLPLFAKYAPEYPCLFKALTHAIPRENQAFRGRKLHIVLEMLPRQPRGYRASEEPRYGETAGPFPYCDLLEKAIAGGFGQDNLPPDVLARPMDDGIEYPLAKRVAPSQRSQGRTQGVHRSVSQEPFQGLDLTSGYAGTAAEQRLVAAIIARSSGRPAAEVLDLAVGLFGPLARGSEVRLR